MFSSKKLLTILFIFIIDLFRWKVFTVPETATVLLRGGVKFSELNSDQTYQFQKDLLLTLIQIEQVCFIFVFFMLI